MEQLDEIIFNAIESLRNNKKHLNEDTPVTMEKLKERLTILLGKEKLLSKLHRENNSYLEIQKNNNLSPQINSTQCLFKFTKSKIAISLTLPVPHKIDSYWLAILMLKIQKKLFDFANIVNDKICLKI